MSSQNGAPGKISKIEQGKKMINRLKGKNPYLNNPEKLRKGREKYDIVKTNSIGTRDDFESAQALHDKLAAENNRKDKNDSIGSDFVSESKNGRTVRNKSNESLRTKIKELDDQGLNFSRDFKIGNFHHKRTEIEWLRGEIEKDKTTNNKVGTSDDFESAHALHGRLAELNKEKNTSPQKPETQEIEKNQPEPAPVPEVKQEIKTQEYTKEEEKLLKDFYNFSAKIRRLPEGKKVSGFLTDLNNFGLRIQNLDNTKTKAFLQSEFASIEMEIHSRNNTETRPDPVPVSEDKKENKKPESKKEKVQKKTLDQHVSDLQRENISNMLSQNMEKVLNAPKQPKLSDRFKKIDLEIINKMNRGEDISDIIQDLNYVAEDINNSQEDGKEELQKEYNHIKKQIQDYNESRKDLFEKDKKPKSLSGDKVENDLSGEDFHVDKDGILQEANKDPVAVQANLAQEPLKPIIDVVLPQMGNSRPRNEKVDKNKSMPHSSIEKLIPQPTKQEYKDLNKFVESIKVVDVNEPQSHPVRSESSSRTTAPDLGEIKNFETGSPESSPVRESSQDHRGHEQNVDDRVLEIVNKYLGGDQKKEQNERGDKREEKKNDKKEKEGFWRWLWNGTREGLKKRDDRLNSPELKKKYEELNASLEKDIGKVGNKSLTIIGDALFGNFLKGIKDGIISNKNWSGAIGEAVGSIVTRYLNTGWNIIEVVGGLFKALGKKAWVSARSLVAK
jgi:hypothetical protein